MLPVTKYNTKTRQDFYLNNNRYKKRDTMFIPNYYNSYNPIRCYMCQRIGHKAKQCFLNKRPIQCFSCGKFGHKVINCNKFKKFPTKGTNIRCFYCTGWGHKQNICPSKPKMSQPNNIGIRIGDKAHYGGLGRILTYKLKNESKGDYVEDVDNMVSKNIDHDLKLHLKNGAFHMNATVKFTVDWLQRNQREDYYKNLKNNFEIIVPEHVGTVLESLKGQIKKVIENSQEEGSGWMYNSFELLELKLKSFKPQTETAETIVEKKVAAKEEPEVKAGSSGGDFIALPSQLSGVAYRNVENNNEHCFKYAIGSALCYQGKTTKTYKNSKKIKSLAIFEKEADAKYNFSKINFPVQCDKKIFAKFEKENMESIQTTIHGEQVEFERPAINVFVLVNRRDKIPLPYYISKEKDPYAKDAINLLFFQDEKGERGHYGVITNISAALCDLTANTRKKFPCYNCLSALPSEDARKEHLKDCNLNQPCQVKLPQPCQETCEHPCNEHKNICSFKNTQYEQCLPVIIVADTESLCKTVRLCKSCNIEVAKDEMEEHYDHGTFINDEQVPIGYKYFVYVDPQYRDVFKGIHGMMDQYTRQNNDQETVGHNMVKNLIGKTTEIYQVIANTKEKIDPKDRKKWNKEFTIGETECHICNKTIQSNNKHLDHDHLTGEVRGWSHPECNWKHTIKRYKIPVVFHNFKSYDSKTILKERGKFPNVKFDIIGENSEKVKTLTVTADKGVSFRFIDSLQHMTKSLEKLVESLANYDGNGSYDEYISKTDVTFLRAQFPETSAHYTDDEKFKMMIRKGVFPYSWFNKAKKLERTKLIPKDKFYNELKEEHITDEQYQFYKDVCEKFEIKTFQQYYDLYLTTDVLLLTDICAWYKQESLKTYGLDPFWFVTSPSMAWNAMLKISGVELELLTDVDMHNFFKKGLRGGLAYIGNKYAKANNPQIPEYDAKKPTTYIKYFDLNNLYGYCMMDSLPVGEFEWVTEIDSIRPETTAEYGYTFEVDIEYPQELHEEHNDFPAAPERFQPPGSKYEKLVNHFLKKERYVANWRVLQMYQDMGCKITKIHRGIRYKVAPFMRDYLNLNTEKRKAAKNDFLKDYYKLMNNSVFGRTIMNKEKFGEYEITNAKRYRWLMRKPHMVKNQTVINRCGNCAELMLGDSGECDREENCCVMIEKHKTTVTLDQPIYVGVTITDLAKLRMYQFWSMLKEKYGKNIKLLMTDTDSFVVQWTCEDLVEELRSMCEEFDFSNYGTEHPLYNVQNKKVPGKMKDEYPNKEITEFVGLRAKCYSLLFDDDTESKTAKGVRAKNKLRFEHYKDILARKGMMYVTETSFRSHNQTVMRETHKKKALSVDDDKRIWKGKREEPFSDGFGETWAWGHKDQIKREEAEDMVEELINETMENLNV